MELSNAQRALITIAYESLMTLTDEIPPDIEQEGSKELWDAFHAICDIRDIVGFS